MKLLLSVGAMALTLTFSAYAEAQQFQALFPDPDMGECFGLLRLENLQVEQIDPEHKSFNIKPNDPNQMELYRRYIAVTGWLRGFFTAMNIAGLTPDRDLTKGTQEKEWMPWIYSYCRSHPKDNLVNAASELAKALSPKSP
jgi:hypothetical protein